MKILQINTCHFRRGGADAVYLNTSQLLLERGHEVINFSKYSDRNMGTFDNQYFVNDIDYFNLSLVRKVMNIPRFIYSGEAKHKIEKLLRIEKPDIAHIHLYKGILTTSILQALKKNNIPIVITLHDYGLLCPHNTFLNGKNEICEKCLITNNSLNCIINRCNRNNLLISTVTALEFSFHKNVFPFSKYFDKLIAVSKFGLEIHSRKTEFKDKITHLYNFYPKLSSTLSNSKKGEYFLYIGRFSSEKGIISLLKAWKKSKSGQMLKLAGEGILLNDVKEFIKENKIINVEVCGFKEGTELEQLINNASFVIVPSEWYENNPLSIIEAYANGKPVIASNVGGIPEIVIENKTGFLFSMANIDLLSQAIDKGSKLSNEDYSIMSENARKFAEDKFSEDKYYDAIMEIYIDLIKPDYSKQL